MVVEAVVVPNQKGTSEVGTTASRLKVSADGVNVAVMPVSVCWPIWPTVRV